MSTPNPVTNIYDLNVNPYTGGFIGSLGGTNNDGNPSDAGNTVIGISTTDGGFTAVPQDGVTTVTIDGSLVSYTVDSNGDATTLLTGTAQQTADAINQNNLTSTTGPLTDTLYYEVQNDGGPITVDSVTSTYGDVDVNISSDSNVNNGALTDSPGTSVSLAGIDVSKFLSDDGNTVAVNPNLSVNIIAFDFGQQALHGTFAVDTSVAQSNGSSVTISDGNIVISGSESAINQDLTSLTYTGGYDGNADPGSYTLGIQTTDDSYVSPPDYSSATYLYGTIDVNCFRAGTRILTERGDVAIENLSPGDAIVSARGGQATQRVTWTGHRRIDCTRHPKPESIWPVLVCKNAFAEGRPARDLWLSPGHSVYAEGVLMQIEKLVNGTTIRQVPCDQVDYWHVEVESHDILFAEGLPAESYLETGNRAAFIGGGESLELHPDFRPKHWTETCVPLVFEGAEMRRTKTMLLGRAREAGYSYCITANDDLHVMADDHRIEAVRLGADRVAFMLPESCAKIHLHSKTFTPAYHDVSTNDSRVLGVCVGRLQIDAMDIALDHESAFAGEGWHGIERNGDQSHRWTRGIATFPAGTRLIVIGLAARGYYWDIERPAAALLVGGERHAALG